MTRSSEDRRILESLSLTIYESSGRVYVRAQSDGTAISGEGHCLVEALRSLADEVVWARTNAPVWKHHKVIGGRND